MKNFTFLFLFLLFTLYSVAQTRQYTEGFDLRVGAGKVMVKDDQTTVLTITEAEVNYKMCPFITYNIAGNYATNRNETKQHTSYYQGNANIFLSPFKNNGKMDFRIGTGLSYSHLVTHKAGDIRSLNTNTYIGQTAPIFGTRNAFGYNLMVENTFTLGQHLVFGVKAFAQRYKDVQSNQGVILKLGVNL